MNPIIPAVLLAGVTMATVAALLEVLLVPVLIAVIMGGPAWVTAKRARAEGMGVAGMLGTRLDRIETKLDDFTAWRISHDVRLCLRLEGASSAEDERFIQSLLEVLRIDRENDEDDG